MSNPWTKAERSLAKDIRQGVVEQRPALSKGKSRGGSKPYSVTGKFFDREFSLGRYATLDDAMKAVSARLRKSPYHGIRLFGPEGEIDLPDTSGEQAE